MHESTHVRKRSRIQTNHLNGDPALTYLSVRCVKCRDLMAATNILRIFLHAEDIQQPK